MYIKTTDSTSSLIRREYMDREDGFYIRADFQTGGRGQQGNRWESEEGRNLMFSMLIHPNLPIEQAWNINIAFALAIADGIRLLCTPADPLTIKWPNDLYIGDRKVCGTLIENFVTGSHIGSSIVGVGLNVNQIRFVSDAPNPTSLLSECYTTQDFDLNIVEQVIIAQIHKQLDILYKHNPYNTNLKSTDHLTSNPNQELNPLTSNRNRYLSQLYRNDGKLYDWEDAEGPFRAKIVDISPIGELILQKESGTHHAYHLKQVKHILPTNH